MTVSVIDMYKKITLIALVLFVIAHSEEVFSTRNVKNASLINSRLSTILPYLSPYNGQHFTKNNTKRSLFLLMPLSQTRDEREKPKEMVQKTKRCNTLRRKNKARTKNPGRDTNVGISKQNSNRMEAEMYKDKTFLRTLKDNLDADNVIVNLASEEKAKKCDMEKYICYCKEENCLPKSSKESSSQILGSSRKDKSEKINHRRTENTRQNISQQRSTRLYHERPYESRVSGQINSFPRRSYQTRVSVPCVSDSYGITPSVSQIVGNERKYVNVRIPCSLFEGRSNFLIGSNVLNHNRPIIRPNSHPCVPITRKDRIGDPAMSITLPSNYIDTTTIAETENDFESYDPTVINKKHFSKLTTEVSNNYVGASVDSKTETNFYPNYSTDITKESTADFSSLDELMHKLEGSTEPTKKDQDDDNSKLTPFLTDYVATSSASPIIYPSLTYDGKFINMKECIKLFGRDVCVLSATSPNMLVEQAQENNLNEYSTIRIPEYVIQTSTKRGTTLNDINYSNKLKTTELYFTSKSSTSGIQTSSSDLHENLESTSTASKANVDETSELYPYTGSIKQIYKPDDDHNENKSSSIIENTRISMKKLMNQTDEIIETVRNKLLGKSKSHTIELSLSPNDKNIANPISDEGFLYSNTSYGFSVDKKVNNLEVGKKNPVTNTSTNSWQSTLHKEETTTISYDSTTRYNFEDESTNYLQKSNTNIYLGEKIFQEQPKEESTTIRYDSKTGHYFEEETTNNLIESNINYNIYPNEEILQERPKEITTISHDSRTGDNFEEESTNSLKKSNANTYPEKESLQEQPKEESTTINHDFKTRYNFEEENTNSLIELSINTYPGEEILQEQPKEITTISHNFRTGHNFEKESTNSLKKSNANTYPGKESLQEQPKEQTITISPNSNTGYNFEGKIRNDLKELKTNIYPEEDILQEQLATMQYSDHELNKESTTNSLEAITDSSTRRLPFCDNTLLLNSIRKVINDFALDTRLTKTKNLDENILQSQGKSLLPEILQVEDLKNILLIPRIENTIIEKVKDVLSDITAIPRKDMTSDWSHGVIRNTLRNILESLPHFHQKLPSMTVEEHKFKDGQWMTNLASITPVPDSKLSIANPENLQKSIKDLLGFSAIASQIDQYIVQNMIVQSVRNDLSNIEENEEMDKSIIHNALDDILQILKSSENIDALEKSNEFISDGKDVDIAFSQEMSTDDYEVGINVGDSILDNKQNFDVKEDTKMDSKGMQTMVYQKAKTLEKNASILITSEPPDLSELYKEDKNTYIEEKIPNETIDKIRENVRDQIVDGMKKIDVQNDEEKKLAEPLETITTYHKAILQNNPFILAPSVELNLTKTKKLNEEGNTKNVLSEATTIMTKDFYEKEKYIADSTSRIKDTNVQNEGETKNSDSWEHTTIYQEPTSNLILAKKSDEHNMNSHSTEECSSKYDEIDLITVHANDDNNKLPINYYSANDPIIKHIKNHYIKDESVKVETTPTNFIQETSSNYIKISDDTISENMTEAKNVRDEMDYTLNGQTSTSADNLISSANVKHRNQESEIAVTSSTDEIDPAIILERIEYNLAPIKYYSPEILKYMKNHRTSDKNIEVITAPTNFMQETSHDYKQMLDNITSQNMAGDKDIEDQIEYILNRKALTSADNLISSTNAKYKNYEPKSTTAIDKDILRSQNFGTEDNIVKIHEVTAEIQRTYAKTTYFKAKPSADDDPRIGSSSSVCEATDCVNNNDKKNKNSKNISNDSNNLIGNKMNNIDSITTEGNEITVSSFKSSSLNDTYSLQLFPSSTASDNISELQKSQLYYINDDVRLPLEITRLKDGSYALSISKNICENIFKRKCPCCVPQQGHVIRSSRTDHYQENMYTITTTEKEDHHQEDMHANDVKRDYQSTSQPLGTMITAINTLRLQEPKEEEERTSDKHHLGKRNLNDDDLASSISMSVIDFAKKYNLLLNFDEEEMLFNETDTYDKIQNKYKYNQSEEKNLNDNLEKKKNELLNENKNAINKSQNFINVRKKKNSLETNFTRSPISQEFPNLGKNSIKIELRKTIAEVNQPDISKEKTEMKNEEMNWDELANSEKGNIKVLHKKKKRQHKETELVNDEQNISSIKVFKENSGKPYRYERTADNIANKRTELVKSMLYWLKDLFFE